MKKIKNILLTFMVLLSAVFLNVEYIDASGANNGLTINYSIHTSKSTVNVGDTVDVSIKVSGHTKKIASNDITLNYDSSLFVYQNYSAPANVTNGDRDINTGTAGKIKYSYADMSGGSNAISSDIIVTFTFKAQSSTNDATGSFSFSVKGIMDEEANVYTLGSTSGSKDVKVHIPSTNNRLSSLTVSGGTLSPQFNADTKNYTVTVDDVSTTISAVTEDSTARVSGTGKKDLEYGENKYTIIVTSESGAENRYFLTITRPDYRSSDATLKEMSVSNTDIKFNGGLAYSATVENEIDSVTVSAKANDSKSTVTGTGTHKLSVGKNNIVIKVIAENGSTKQYTIVITRNAKENTSTKDKSSNNYLSSITVEGATFVFDKDTNYYTLNVANTQSKLVLNYKKEDSKATVKVVGDENLIVGNNSVSLVVTAEDGQVRTYDLTIIRSEEKFTVENNKDAILDALDDTVNSVTIGIKNNSNAITLDSETLEKVKNTNKDLVFEWYDSNDVLESSLTIKASDITGNMVNPNVSKNVTNETLKTYLNGYTYDGISIVNSNLPTSSIYRLRVDNQTSAYYLYYVENGTVKNKTLSVKDGYIEFKLENGMEYALSKENVTAVSDDTNNERSVLVPIMVVIIIALIFAITAVLVYRRRK